MKKSAVSCFKRKGLLNDLLHNGEEFAAHATRQVSLNLCFQSVVRGLWVEVINYLFPKLFHDLYQPQMLFSFTCDYTRKINLEKQNYFLFPSFFLQFSWENRQRDRAPSPRLKKSFPWIKTGLLVSRLARQYVLSSIQFCVQRYGYK